MTDARLTQTESSEVFRVVTDQGFDSADFRWEEKRGNESFRSNMGGDQIVVSVLIHKPTHFYVRFGAFANEFSPGVDKRVEYEKDDGIWMNRIRSCTTWLKELREEVEAPDMLATIEQATALSLAAASRQTANDPFTAAELRLIPGKLDEIKVYLLENSRFSSGQNETIEQEIAYLKESATRLGRKDWLNVFREFRLSSGDRDLRRGA